MSGIPLEYVIEDYDSIYFTYRNIKYTLVFDFIVGSPSDNYVPIYCKIRDRKSTQIIYDMGIINALDYTDIGLINQAKRILKRIL